MKEIPLFGFGGMSIAQFGDTHDFAQEPMAVEVASTSLSNCVDIPEDIKALVKTRVGCIYTLTVTGCFSTK